jgi:hypothetical protein
MRSTFTHQPPHILTSKSRYSTSKPPPNTSENSELPSFSFKDLGANRTVKIVVIVALTIGGTAESVFWAQMLWAKFGPEKKEDEEIEGSSS